MSSLPCALLLSLCLLAVGECEEPESLTVQGDLAKVDEEVSTWAEGEVKKSFGGGTWHSVLAGQHKYLIIDLHPTSGIHSSEVTVYQLTEQGRELLLEMPRIPHITRDYELRDGFLGIYKTDWSRQNGERSLELRVRLP